MKSRDPGVIPGPGHAWDLAAARSLWEISVVPLCRGARFFFAPPPPPALSPMEATRMLHAVLALTGEGEARLLRGLFS